MTLLLVWVTVTAVALTLLVSATAVLIPTLHTLHAALTFWRAINTYLNLTPWFWGLERKQPPCTTLTSCGYAAPKHQSPAATHATG